MNISIVTPSFNQAQYVGQTIESVLSQIGVGAEYFVVDGFSSDNSMEVISRYLNRLSGFVCEVDRGQADAINKGIALCSGEIVGWINSDDLLCSGALRRVIGAFEEDETIDVVCGFRKVLCEGVLVPWCHPDPTYESISAFCHLAQETVFFKKALFDHVGGLDIDLKYLLDYDLWLKFVRAGARFKLIKNYQGVFRHHPASKGSTMAETRQSEMSKLYKRHFDIDVPPEECERLEERRSRSLQWAWRARWDLVKRIQNSRLRGSIFAAQFCRIICSI